VKNVDVEKLKKELINYYEVGAMSGFPAMIVEISHIESMSDDEVVQKAKELKIIS
jgi:hypothetical protein